MAFHEIDGIEPVLDLSVAGWIPASLWSWHEGPEVGVRAGAVVPPVFEAYARLLHPARADGAKPDERLDVQWTDVAAWSGREVHSAMQWGAIRTSIRGKRWAGDAPNEGSIPHDAIAALMPMLQSATTTPDRLYLAVWDGYGFWYPAAHTYLDARPTGWSGIIAVFRRRMRHRRERRQPSVIDGLPLLVTEGRKYVVFSGSSAVPVAMTGPPWRQSPNLWWPDDRAWCVGTEIDLDSTLLGGSRALIGEILANPNLEALEISPDVRLDHRGDQHNDPDGTLSRLR